MITTTATATVTTTTKTLEEQRPALRFCEYLKTQKTKEMNTECYK
jgi:hypothetical protein